MTPHKQIVKLVRDALMVGSNPLSSVVVNKTDDEVCHLLFDNFRGTVDDGKGLRLSELGLQLMKSVFKASEVKMPGGYLPHHKHWIYLDRVSKLPYHLTKDFCCVFDTEFAAMLILSGGDLQTLIDSRYRLLGDTGLEQDI